MTAMASVYLCVGLLGVAAEVWVLHTLIRSQHSRFAGVGFCLAVLLLTDIADGVSYLSGGGWTEWYVEYYYLNNAARILSRLAALVSLAYLASTVHTRGTALLKILLGAVAVIAASALLASGSWPHEYMIEATRNLSFASVILNTMLWLSLIKNRTSDTQLFLVSGGLGLNMAGEAIGQSLLQMADVYALLVHAGGVFVIGSQLLCLFIWGKAFQYETQRSVVANGVPAH